MLIVKIMRKPVLFCICLLSLAIMFSCHNKNDDNNSGQISSNIVNITATADNPHPAPNTKLPKMVFTDTTFNFGTITEGDIVSHLFIFKNEGQSDLVISNASASCGCTIPSYPHQVKHPGDTGSINVTFNSTHKSGKVEKLVTIVCNSDPPVKYLTITANIQPLNK